MASEHGDPCVRGCGKKTRHEDGVCSGCAVDERTEREIRNQTPEPVDPPRGPCMTCPYFEQCGDAAAMECEELDRWVMGHAEEG